MALRENTDDHSGLWAEPRDWFMFLAQKAQILIREDAGKEALLQLHCTKVFGVKQQTVSGGSEEASLLLQPLSRSEGGAAGSVRSECWTPTSPASGRTPAS